MAGRSRFRTLTTASTRLPAARQEARHRLGRLRRPTARARVLLARERLARLASSSSLARSPPHPSPRWRVVRHPVKWRAADGTVGAVKKKPRATWDSVARGFSVLPHVSPHSSSNHTSSPLARKATSPHDCTGHWNHSRPANPSGFEVKQHRGHVVPQILNFSKSKRATYLLTRIFFNFAFSLLSPPGRRPRPKPRRATAPPSSPNLGTAGGVARAIFGA